MVGPLVAALAVVALSLPPVAAAAYNGPNP